MIKYVALLFLLFYKLFSSHNYMLLLHAMVYECFYKKKMKILIKYI